MTIDVEFIKTFLDEAHDALEEWEALCLRLEKSASPRDVDSLFRVAHNIKGSSKSVGLKALGRLVHKVEDILLLIKEGKSPWTKQVSHLLLKTHSCLNSWVEHLRENHSFLPDHDELFEELVQFHAELDGGKVEPSPEFAGFGFFDETETPVEPQAAEDEDPHLKKSSSSETVRVAAGKLDSILQTLGELSIARSILTHGHKKRAYEEPSFGEAINLLDSMVRELQQTAFSLRMQALTHLFQRLERTAHDVAEDLGKKVQILTVGEETELDRKVAERLMDAMIHIIRNCVDHGLESSEARTALGKNPVGTIEINAENVGSYIVISIEDDGAGLDQQKILAKAIETKIIDTQHKMTEAEIHRIILLPGFSTSSSITSISGRGVGMDVVKTSVEELGGSLNLRSKKGEGTRFEISIPTTMSIIDSIIVELDKRSYAVPVSDLAEIIDLRSQTVESSEINNRMILRGQQFIPLISLSSYLLLNETEPSAPKSRNIALLIVHQGHFLAFEIDAVLHKQPVVVRPLSEKFNQYRGVTGSTILADGKPALILSMQAFGHHFFESQKGRKAA